MRQIVKKAKKCILLFATLCWLLFFSGTASFASDTPIPFSFDLTVSAAEDGADVVSSIQILVILTLIALAPSIIIMTTSFTRLIVVLHFVRSALGTQQTPPNQVLLGLALFLTLFIMTPVMTQINETALQPYSEGVITQEEAIDVGLEPIRDYMFEQLRGDRGAKDLALFVDIARVDLEIDATTGTILRSSIPTTVLIPAFIINELRIAFIIGFLIYIPFIAIDMIVASTLMSMGMMMLPPVMISLPFKILLFVLADGWNLIIGEVVKTFYG